MTGTDTAGQVSCTRYLPLPGRVQLVATPISQEYQAADHHGTASVAVDPATGQADYQKLDKKFPSYVKGIQNGLRYLGLSC